MTMPMLINAPMVAGASAIEDAGAATMGGTMAGAAGPVTAVLPPGGEDSSAAAEAMLTQLTVIRTLFAQTMGTSGVAYAATDALNEATLAL